MNSKGHLAYSLAKSIIRILGCIGALIASGTTGIAQVGLSILAGSFLTAEILGVFEELADDR